jgi:aldose 1-epimerase
MQRRPLSIGVLGLLSLLTLASCTKRSAPPVEAPVSEPAVTAPARTLRASVERRDWGSDDGNPVELFTLTNDAGAVLEVTSYGATVTSLKIPDKAGQFADVVLGYAELGGYRRGRDYMGATLGRVANRIDKGRFRLAGENVQLAENFAGNHYNGGFKGWDKAVWDAESAPAADGPRVVFSRISPGGEERYPGSVTAKVIYTLLQDNSVIIEMEASADKVTVVNMAHEIYWNLAGQDQGNILEHELELFAEHYLDPKSSGLKSVKAVAGTPFDFTSPKSLGKDLPSGGAQDGYEHDFMIEGNARELRPVAKLRDPKSGRTLELLADQPSLRLYSGNRLDGMSKGKGVSYEKHAGVCLVSGSPPNAVNVADWEKYVVLEPGATYRHTMVHRFSAE